MTQGAQQRRRADIAATERTEGSRDTSFPIGENVIRCGPRSDGAGEMRSKNATARHTADHVEVTEQSALVEPAHGAEMKQRGAISPATQAEGVARTSYFVTADPGLVFSGGEGERRHWGWRGLDAPVED